MPGTMFEKLANINVNDKVEKKTSGGTTLSYLSWAYAWSEFKKVYPDATYEIKKFANKDNELVPYMYDSNTGYMVMTSVMADGLEYEMWLPVMDNNNRAMKSEPYTITTSKGKEINVAAASMFDVNKTIMRCLVKNLAMFGLGLYIYAGEDLPDDMDAMTEETKTNKAKDLLEQIKSGTQEEVSLLYKTNKKLIAGTPTLMDALTKRSKELKGIA